MLFLKSLNIQFIKFKVLSLSYSQKPPFKDTPPCPKYDRVQKIKKIRTQLFLLSSAALHLLIRELVKNKGMLPSSDFKWILATLKIFEKEWEIFWFWVFFQKYFFFWKLSVLSFRIDKIYSMGWFIIFAAIEYYTSNLLSDVNFEK